MGYEIIDGVTKYIFKRWGGTAVAARLMCEHEDENDDQILERLEKDKVFIIIQTTGTRILNPRNRVRQARKIMNELPCKDVILPTQLPAKRHRMRYNLEFSFDAEKIPLSEVYSFAGKFLNEIRDVAWRHNLMLETQRTYRPK